MRIWAFLGLWCPDCEDSVPELIRILRQVDFPQASLRLIVLGRNKTYFPWTAKFEVRRVPTFLIEAWGDAGWREHGRLVEPPAAGLLTELTGLVRKAREVGHECSG